jgi:hypothetical protein
LSDNENGNNKISTDACESMVRRRSEFNLSTDRISLL